MTLDRDELERKAKSTPDGAWMEDVGPSLILALIERVRDAEAEKAADAERAEYWRVEANRVHAEALAKANERVRELEWVVTEFMSDPHAFTPRAVDAAKKLGFKEGRDA